MIVLYEVIDPDAPGSRHLFSEQAQALAYRQGVEASYGQAAKVISHTLPDASAIIAFLYGDYRDWNSISYNAILK